MFLDEIGIWTRLNKAGCFPQCGGPCPISWRSKEEKKADSLRVRGNSFCLTALNVTLIFACPQTRTETAALRGSWACWLWDWNLGHQNLGAPDSQAFSLGLKRQHWPSWVSSLVTAELGTSLLPLLREPVLYITFSLCTCLLSDLFLWRSLTNADLHIKKEVTSGGRGVVSSGIVFSCIPRHLVQVFKSQSKTNKITSNSVAWVGGISMRWAVVRKAGCRKGFKVEFHFCETMPYLFSMYMLIYVHVSVFVHYYMSTGKSMEGHVLGCYRKMAVWGVRLRCGWSHEGGEQGCKTKQNSHHRRYDTLGHTIINV